MPTFGAANSKPHVLFTLVDDWGWELWPRSGSDKLGSDASTRELLPNVAQLLVDDGLTLARHYAFMYCAPSRQSLLSGRWPVHGNEANSNCRGVPLGIATLADQMSAGGYRSHFVGKWHCGVATAASTPARRGFDTSLGFYGKAIDHYSYCSADAERGCRTTEGWEGDGDGGEVIYDLFEGSHGADCARGAAHHLATAGAFSTDAFAHRITGIIEQHDTSDGARPLFVLASFAAPHGPLQAPASYTQHARRARGGDGYYAGCSWGSSAARCDGDARQLYEAMAAGVDAALGQMATSLRARGMWQTSLLIWTSDNGGNIGVQYSNAPLRGGKNGMWEGGVRTVAALGGGYLAAALRGRTSQAVMHVADWHATLSFVAGVEPSTTDAAPAPPADSRSMWPAWTQMLAAQQAEEPDRDLGGARLLPLSSQCLLEVSESPAQLLKLLRGVQCECKVGKKKPPNDYCLTACFDCGPVGCLYDVLADPAEAENLAATEPHTLARLGRHLDAVSPWLDTDPRNQGCETPSKGYHLAFAAAHGGVMQPYLDEHGRPLPISDDVSVAPAACLVPPPPLTPIPPRPPPLPPLPSPCLPLQAPQPLTSLHPPPPPPSRPPPLPPLPSPCVPLQAPPAPQPLTSMPSPPPTMTTVDLAREMPVMEPAAMVLLGAIAWILGVSCCQGSRPKESTSRQRRKRRGPRQGEERAALAPSVEIAEFHRC